MSFDDDAYDRLQQALAGVPHQSRLDPAARLAGRQLEWLKPSVMNITKLGFYAGPAAQVERGIMLIVLADQRRVLTLHVGTRDTMAVMAHEVVTNIETHFPSIAGNPANVMEVVRQALKKYGGDDDPCCAGGERRRSRGSAAARDAGDGDRTHQRRRDLREVDEPVVG